MEKVIVVVDPEREATEQPALEWAIVRAQSSPTLLEVVVVSPLSRSRLADDRTNPAAPYVKLVERAADIARTRTPETRVTEAVRRGVPSRVILGISRRADLLVLSSHRAGRLEGIVHGTLALQVAGRSECPVVAIPQGWEPGGEGVVVGWTDESTADRALDVAAREAAAAHTPLTIVTSWTEPFGDESAPLVELLGELVERAAARVRHEHPGLVVDVAFQRGSAAVAIVEAGRRASLTVVGSHGRGALGSLILGSVSHDVLTNMPSPVMVVPAEEPVTVLPEIGEEDES